MQLESHTATGQTTSSPSLTSGSRTGSVILGLATSLRRTRCSEEDPEEGLLGLRF